jgi:septation ring formation regulator EzrA
MSDSTDPYATLEYQLTQLKLPLERLVQNYYTIRDLNKDEELQKLDKQLSDVQSKLAGVAEDK